MNLSRFFGSSCIRILKMYTNRIVILFDKIDNQTIRLSTVKFHSPIVKSHHQLIKSDYRTVKLSKTEYPLSTPHRINNQRRVKYNNVILEKE